MKSWIVCIVFICLIPVAPLQAASSNVSYGIAIGPVLKVSQLDDSAISMFGIKALYIIERIFTVGAAFYGMIGQNGPFLGTDEGLSSFAYSGPTFGVRLQFNELICLDLSTMLGYGLLQFQSAKLLLGILEPEVNAEVKLLSFLSVGAGLSYRFTFPFVTETIDSTQLSGLGVQLYVFLGHF